MRVENPELVVEPGAGRTGKLAMVVYQFQQEQSLDLHLCTVSRDIFSAASVSEHFE
jgi:hypothetical protein